MTPKVIVTAGMQGSGSTWLYNAVRYACLNAGHTVYGVFATAYKPDTDAEVHVIKAHDYDEALADRADFIMMTTRDLFDVAASCIEKENGIVRAEPEELKTFLRDRLENERKWWSRVNLVVLYEELKYAPCQAVARIQHYLDLLAVSEHTVRDLDNLARTVNNHGDHVTHMWPHHIKDGGVRTYGKRLSHECIRAVADVIVEEAER